MEKPKKMTKRKLQAEATKQKICDAAVELMEEMGFNNMTIHDINEKAGVSVGTFYHYFSTKEDVFFELYRKADDYFENEALPKIHDGDNSANDKIILFFKYYARFNSTNGLDYVSHLYSTKNKFFIAKGRYMIELLQKLVREGVENGEFSGEMNPEEISDFLITLSRGIVFDWCLHEGDYDLEHRMTIHYNMIMTMFTDNSGNQEK